MARNSVRNSVLKKFDHPDYQKMRTKMNRIHPRCLNHRYRTKDDFGCGSCCGFDVGNNFFCSTSAKRTSMDQYGPAMVLYFRFLKSTIYFVLLCAILNSLLVYLYIRAYSETQTENTLDLENSNIILLMRDVTLSASLGGYASGSNRFYEANFSSINQLNSSLNNLTNSNPNEIQLECPKGTIDVTEAYTFYGLIELKFPSSYTFYMFEKQYNNATNFYQSINSCQGFNQCTVQYSPSWFTSYAAAYIEGKNGQSKHKLYLKYHCQGIDMTFFGQDFNKQKLNYLIIIVNLLILTFFILYLITWSFYEKKIFTRFRSTVPHPSDYTLKIKNLPQHWNEDMLGQNLYDHLSKFGRTFGIKDDFIVDINMAKNNSILYLDQLIKNYRIRVSVIIEKLSEDKVIEMPPQGTPLDVKWVLEYRLLHPDVFSQPKVKKVMDALLKALKKQQKYKALREVRSEEKESFQSVFVTFNTNFNKVMFYNAMNLTKFKRFRLQACETGNSVSTFGNKVLSVKNPPEPENITWENLQVSPFEKKIRRTVSWLITILLIGVPIIVVILISLNLKKQESFKSSCPKSSILAEENMTDNTQEVLLADFTSGDQSENLMFCYCYADFRNRINK